MEVCVESLGGDAVGLELGHLEGAMDGAKERVGVELGAMDVRSTFHFLLKRRPRKEDP